MLYLWLQGITAEKSFTRFTGYGIEVTSKSSISTNTAKLITLGHWQASTLWVLHLFITSCVIRCMCFTITKQQLQTTFRYSFINKKKHFAELLPKINYVEIQKMLIKICENIKFTSRRWMKELTNESWKR